MVDAMRAMLDELMGRERDVPLEQRTGKGTKFSDPEVCKYALAGLCPYGLFKNTKSDLGVCEFDMHEDDIQFEELKLEWDGLTEKERQRYGYETDLLRLLDRLIKDMDRKIERQKDRASKESAPRELTAEDKDKLDAIKAKEKEALQRSEKLAEDGDVDGSVLFAQQAETFKAQHDTMHAAMTAPERTMTVCDTCGVFINSTDNEQRRKDHLSGKQYLGWKAIRDKQAELQEKLAAKRADGGGAAAAEPEEEPEPGERPDSGRERDRHRERDRDRDRDRNRDRHQDGDRDRDRERDRGGHRSSERKDRERDDRDRRRDRSPHNRHHRGTEVPPPDSYRGGGGAGGRRRERDRNFDDYAERDSRRGRY